jgi:mono/diheme cytochrome c family protein
MHIRPAVMALSALIAFLSQGPLLAEQSQPGEREFRSHCAGCHGLDGEGNGPFVEFLKSKPPPLTTLAQENQGVFPFRRVYAVIEGRQQIAGHGTTDMPVWGERYATEMIRQYGEFDTEHRRTVRCRILELVFYLATIQKP